MDRVFAEGEMAKGFPLIARYVRVPPDGPAPTRVAFTVSKKRLRKAVHRNRVKRLMREMWRNHRSAFESTLPPDTQCAVVLIFVGKDLPSAAELERGMVKLLGRMTAAASDNA